MSMFSEVIYTYKVITGIFFIGFTVGIYLFWTKDFVSPQIYTTTVITSQRRKSAQTTFKFYIKTVCKLCQCSEQEHILSLQVPPPKAGSGLHKQQPLWFRRRMLNLITVASAEVFRASILPWRRKKNVRPKLEPHTKDPTSLEYFIHKTKNGVGEARCVLGVKQQTYLQRLSAK